MKLRYFAMAGAVAMLAACGDNSANDPAALKGASFVSEQPGTNITLTFDADEMRVNGRVVNIYNGEYTVDGNKISFGPMATTMMMGPADAMETEQKYFKFMETANSYELNGERLVIKNPDGTEIIFTQMEKSAPADDAETETSDAAAE